MDADPPNASSPGADPARQEGEADIESTSGICATCGRPLVRRGPREVCTRCLVNFATLLDDDALEEEPAVGNPSTVAVRRYGHFEILTRPDGSSVELGRGSMGTTYRAQDTMLQRVVALKVIERKIAEHPAARARFLREARAAAQFQHPNVAAVSQYGEQAGECFYAMELVEGETLDARVLREGPLPVALTLEIAVQVTRALVAAEARGIIHRDLKPTNLMLTDGGVQSDAADVPVVKVIDFGLAKALSTAAGTDGQHGTRGAFVGTPAFASPEQFASAEESRIDHRSDIYALGVTMWYALNGRVPFVGGTLEEIQGRQRGPLPVEQLAARKVPRTVVVLLASMLSVDPANRPQSARELLGGLRRCQEISDHAVSKRMRMFRRAMVAAALALVVLAGFWWTHRREKLKLEDRSVAVLPFENLSPKPDDAFYATGVQDEVTANLARVAALKVISSSSADQYPPDRRDFARIGAELGVRFLLEGNVRRDEDQVRITVRLVDVAQRIPAWSHTYNRRLTDVFVVQSEITRTVADLLQTTLTDAAKAAIDEPPTTDLAAYDLFLRAETINRLATSREEFRPVAVRKLDLLRQAVTLDPKFMVAYCRIAAIHDGLYKFQVDISEAGRPMDHRTLAESALEKARRLQPDAGEVHMALASHLYMVVKDLEQARIEADLARRSLPNDCEAENWAGLIAQAQGRWPDALLAMERAANLDPRDPINFNLLEELCRSMRRYDKADHALGQAIDLASGEQAGYFRVERATVQLEATGDLAPLRAALAAIPPASGPPSLEMNRFLLAYFDRDAETLLRTVSASPRKQFRRREFIYPKAWFEALAARLRGDEPAAMISFAAARTEVEKMLTDGPAGANARTESLLAIIDAGLGRKEDAVAEGRRASELVNSDQSSPTAAIVNNNLAVVYAWIGQPDLAISLLEAWLKKPAGPNILFQPTYGDLKLSPMWDPLRGDKRFLSLVEQLAPATTKASPGK